MSALEDAIVLLERAVARLEAATVARPSHLQLGDPQPTGGVPDQAELEAATAALAGRIDAALSKLGQLLEQES